MKSPVRALCWVKTGGCGGWGYNSNLAHARTFTNTSLFNTQKQNRKRQFNSHTVSFLSHLWQLYQDQIISAVLSEIANRPWQEMRQSRTMITPTCSAILLSIPGSGWSCPLPSTGGLVAALRATTVMYGRDRQVRLVCVRDSPASVTADHIQFKDRVGAFRPSRWEARQRGHLRVGRSERHRQTWLMLTV